MSQMAFWFKITFESFQVWLYFIIVTQADKCKTPNSTSIKMFFCPPKDINMAILHASRKHWHQNNRPLFNLSNKKTQTTVSDDPCRFVRIQLIIRTYFLPSFDMSIVRTIPCHAVDTNCTHIINERRYLTKWNLLIKSMQNLCPSRLLWKNKISAMA